MHFSQLSDHNYFTCLSTDAGGLTHQLKQFILSYKLGLSLDYRYIHTPLASPRSSLNIYHFLGFNDQFKLSTSNLCLDNFIFFDISLAKIAYENNLTHLAQMQDAIRKLNSEKENLDKKVIICLDS